MCMSIESIGPLALNDHRLKGLQKLCYLGSLITKEAGAVADVNQHRAKATAAFRFLRRPPELLEGAKNIKKRVIKDSLLLYSLET